MAIITKCVFLCSLALIYVWLQTTVWQKIHATKKYVHNNKMNKYTLALLLHFFDGCRVTTPANTTRQMAAVNVCLCVSALTPILQWNFTYVRCNLGGGKLFYPRCISGSVPPRDKIPMFSGVSFSSWDIGNISSTFLSPYIFRKSRKPSSPFEAVSEQESKNPSPPIATRGLRYGINSRPDSQRWERCRS